MLTDGMLYFILICIFIPIPVGIVMLVYESIMRKLKGGDDVKADASNSGGNADK